MAYRNVIVGSGVAGLVTALLAAARGPVLLLVRPGFRCTVPVRIDSVPTQTIAALLELGADPRRFSDLRRHRTRLAAWSSAEPIAVEAPETVHVERGNLEAALYHRAIHHPRIRLAPAPIGRKHLLAFLGQPRLRGAIVIDATGRAALLAREQYRTPGGWQAWTVQLEVRAGRFDSDLRIAATPDGYGYRLGMGHRLTLGHVSFRAQRAESGTITFERLRCEHAFLFEGVPDFGVRDGLRVCLAALQWSRHEGVTPVGDAALVRDSLSSQGLACAISEAHYAAAVATRRDAELFQCRVREQRISHLRYLSRVLADSRYVRDTAWAQYRRHVLTASASSARDESPVIALRHGSLVQVARASAARA
jgi:flavin-dependent dehydrogenase